MTERLYYDDSYTTDFTARVTAQREIDGRPAVILDRTYFYPTGGGQPHDTGMIEEVEVIDVVADGDAVLHILAEPLPGGSDEVQCHIDWGRRFHHMQHHTGQHILTQAFVTTADAHTVGFHLGTESITIDLDTQHTPDDLLKRAEMLANRVLFEDRPVTATTISPDEADDVRMRRMPDTLLTDGLRVVEVTDFDRTACGGTHVSRTGEIGLLKILKTERRGDTTRVEFRCGWRALQDYMSKHDILVDVSNQLTCGYDQVSDAIDRLRDDLKSTQKALERAQEKLVDYEAADLLEQAPRIDGVRLVELALTDQPNARALASRLVEAPETVALIGVAGEKVQVITARSDDLAHDMRPALQAALDALPDARGGGRPDFAQGGGGPATRDQVAEALAAARQALFASA